MEMVHEIIGLIYLRRTTIYSKVGGISHDTAFGICHVGCKSILHDYVYVLSHVVCI